MDRLRIAARERAVKENAELEMRVFDQQPADYRVVLTAICWPQAAHEIHAAGVTTFDAAERAFRELLTTGKKARRPRKKRVKAPAP